MMRYGLSLLLTAILSVAAVSADVTTPPADYDPSVCTVSADADDAIASALAAANSDACLAMMQAFPWPRVQRIQHDNYTLENYSFWRVGPGAVALYEAPGGGVVGQMPAGFNFITAINTGVDGWVQRDGGEWLRREDAEHVRPSTLRGLLLPEGWTHPFAVILDRTGIHASLRPGEKPNPDSGYVTRRYQLVNIYARAEDERGKIWYLIGPQRWIRQEYVAKFAPTPRPDGVSGRWMAVDLFEQTLIAYEDDTPIFATLVSSGLPDWSTREGIFEIWARLKSDAMSGAAGQPDAYALQHVPWVLYFDRGISFHGTYWHDSFGYRHSHGCVNLTISDARWLFEWTAASDADEAGEIVNQVVVFSSGVYETG